jgi:RES domain-containing protein
VKFYRIARADRAKTALEAFSGDGSAKRPGRWNHKGVRTVYCADTLAGACLETLVHIRPLPRAFPPSVFFEFEIDDALLEVHPTAALPKSWNAPVVTNETRDFGSDFLTSARNVGLLIPTVVIPRGWNLVLNPCHMAFEIDTVKGPFPFYYDPRLE